MTSARATIDGDAHLPATNKGPPPRSLDLCETGGKILRARLSCPAVRFEAETPALQAASRRATCAAT